MALARPSILFFNPVRHALAQYQDLSSRIPTGVISSSSRAEFFKDVEGKYRDIVAIYSTSSSYAVRLQALMSLPLLTETPGCWKV